MHDRDAPYLSKTSRVVSIDGVVAAVLLISGRNLPSSGRELSVVRTIDLSVSIWSLCLMARLAPLMTALMSDLLRALPVLVSHWSAGHTSPPDLLA